jgi:hypothetical protein
VTVTAALGDLTLSWDLPTLSGSGIGSADEFAAALLD